MGDIKEYVSHILIEIVGGIVDAQRGVSEIGGKINPSGLNISDSSKDLILKTSDANLAGFVEFDINIVAESVKKGEGGFSLSIFKVGANAKLSDSDKQSNTHKIKFRVPVLFPAHETTINT